MDSAPALAQALARSQGLQRTACLVDATEHEDSLGRRTRDAARTCEVLGADRHDVDAPCIECVQKGVASVMGAGPLIGFPIVDVKFILTDGAYHDVDSSVLAFEIAGRAGFKEAIEKASPKILEPIMRVEVLTPEDYVGDVIGDLNSRRGQIRGTEGRGVAQVIDAMVPLANMFGYVNSLRSMSQGRAQYTMTFDHYEQVPNAVAQEVQAKYA